MIASARCHFQIYSPLPSHTIFAATTTLLMRTRATKTPRDAFLSNFSAGFLPRSTPHTERADQFFMRDQMPSNGRGSAFDVWQF